MRTSSVWAIVVAGGSGSRFGRPKQFDLLDGRPVVSWAVASARAVATGVVVVVPAGSEIPPDADIGGDVVVEGGPTRSASVRRGLEAVPETADIVVVHDAARPLATPALFRAVLDPLTDGAGTTPAGVVCAVPVADTLKRLAEDGVTVAATVERSQLVSVQTPQAFRAAVLRRAHAGSGEATDDAALVERLGGVVRVVPGERGNVKLTVPEDLALAEELLAARVRAEGRRRSPANAP